jgi:5-methylcytosine-specific restriction protein A
MATEQITVHMASRRSYAKNGGGTEIFEAHHLIPIAMLKGQKVSRNPKTDFAVLCANCHRMIHRFESPWDLDAFRKTMRIVGQHREI